MLVGTLGNIFNKKDGIKMLDENLSKKIIEKQGDLLYTTLAEECTELAQACCKINRNKFLGKDISDRLDNFFEEICYLQINLELIKKQVIQETGMSSEEYDQYIKNWEDVKKDKLRNIFLSEEEDLEPIICKNCGSEHYEDRDFYKEELYVVEFSRYCKDCGAKLGDWAYGQWGNLK